MPKALEKKLLAEAKKKVLWGRGVMRMYTEVCVKQAGRREKRKREWLKNGRTQEKKKDSDKFVFIRFFLYLCRI